jgi:hypothetical protein
VEDCVEKNEGIYNQISLQDAKKQAKIYAVDRASLQGYLASIIAYSSNNTSYLD